MPRASGLVAVALLVGAAPAGGEVRLEGVRHWSYPGFTRVSVELSAPVPASEVRVGRLASDAGAGRPERLYLDFRGTRLAPAAARPLAVGDGLLQGVRVGQNTPSRARVVLDLERYGRHRLRALESPPRVVVDVFSPSQTPPPSPAPAARAAAGRTVPARRPARRPALPPPGPIAAWERRVVRTVVLDPGHGGRDPGAIGLDGLTEKELTLDLARRMERRLRRWGFRVVMTRDGDETVDLETRTALAEGGRGDVFLSLHVNASPRPGLRGIETFHLDQGDERHSVDVAARENGISEQEVDVLQTTLASLRISEVGQRSALLAEYVHGAIVRGLRARYGDTEDLGVRKGPFYVLFLSSMPAILVEIGFATNERDAKRLQDEAYLELVADRISSGLMAYAIATAPALAGERP